MVARRAHNPKVGGSNPSPATRIFDGAALRGGFVLSGDVGKREEYGRGGRGTSVSMRLGDAPPGGANVIVVVYRTGSGAGTYRGKENLLWNRVQGLPQDGLMEILGSLVVRARRTHPFSFRTRK